MKIYAQSELIAQYISGMAVTLVCQQCGQTAAAAAAQPRLSWNIIIIVVVVAVNGFDTLAWCEQNMRSLLWFITLFIFGACLIMYTKCSNAFTITTTTKTATEAKVNRNNNNNCSCNTHRGGSVAGEQQLRQKRRRNLINKTRPLRCCCCSSVVVVVVGVAGD